MLAWRVRSVFAPGQARDILISYDGSNVSLYMDGKKEARVYHLSPGANVFAVNAGDKLWLAEVERVLLEEAFKRHGTKTDAAAAVGLTREGFRMKLIRMGID